MFEKYQDPIFLKSDSSAEKELEYLKQLPLTPEIEQQIKLTEAGILGEKQIEFELKNSHMPMYILHDIYLKHNGLSAQIDYLIVCPKKIYILECKNLYGNIEINEKGDFIRTISFGKYYKKEGIYSPITQNQRHLDLIQQIITDSKSNNLLKTLSKAATTNFWQSVVVLANPKTVLNDKKAPKEIKDKIIRADQLINYIKQTENNSKIPKASDKEMLETAKIWLADNKENPVDYTTKFQTKSEKPQTTPNTEEAPICPKCGIPMIKRTASKGENAGKEFWGCPNFPKCWNKLSID